jgi:DNA adenine methylase
LHGDLVTLARVIQHRDCAEELYDKLQRVLVTEDLLEQARAELGNGEFPPIGATVTLPERAYWYFIASWMGRNGTAGTARVDYQIAVRWTKGGGSPTVRWRNAVESLPWWHQRLRNVVILKRDAFNIVGRFEDVKETAIYADPPYHGNSRSGNQKNGRGGTYMHEFRHSDPLFGDDHKRLAEILRGYRKARVVVSYYDCPQIRELYEGWTFVEHTRQKHLHAQNGRGARPKEAPEILIINGPSYAQAV